MSTIARYLKILIRVSGGGALLLGLAIWAGYLLSWLPVHLWLGVALVLSMWAAGALALGAGTRRGLAAVVFLWGIGIVAFGQLQGRLLPGPRHWIISLAHLLAGGLAIGLGAALANAIELARREA